MKQYNDPSHHWRIFCLCKVPSRLTTSFKLFKMDFSSGLIEIRFLELANVNKNYANWLIFDSDIMGI